jgi:hypothetical protein
VLTSDAELFGQHKSFLLRLAGAQVTHATLVVSGKNAGAAFKTELDAAIAEVKKSADAPDSPLNGPGLGKMLEWMISVARDLDTIVMRIEPTEDGAKLAIDVSAVAQSALDKSMRLLGERKLALLDDIPVDAPAAFVMSIDPDNDDELTRSLTAWSLQLSLGQQVDEKYADAMNAYWKATTGDMAFAAHSAPRGHAPRGHAPRGHAPRGHAVPGDAPKDDGTEPKLRFSALTGIRDAAAARAAQETLRGMYDEEKLAKLYADMGVKVSFKPNAYKVADVEVGVVSAELADTRGDAKLDLKRALGATAGLLTDMMNSHVAIGDELGVMVYGTDAKPVMEAWLGGKMSGGLDKSRGVARAMKHAAEGMFMLAYGSPSEVMRSLNPQIPTLGGAAKDGGIALSVGATKGVLHLVLDLPSSQASALAAGLMTLR